MAKVVPKIIRFWDADHNKGLKPAFPAVKRKIKSVRVTLRAPPSSTFGWTPSSKGFVWWYEGIRDTPRLSHGSDMIKNLKSDLSDGRFDGMEPICEKIHVFSHRYARPGKKGKETMKEHQIYHGAILLEWSHKKYVTVVELATLNGVGGRRGKANWYDDKFDDFPELYKAMPPEMITPWKGEFAELRVHDVPAKSMDEFWLYVKKY